MPSPSAPPAPSRRAAPLPPEERRAAIIDAVLPLLIEHGAAITTRQIANAAGVSEGTIFNVFSDKHELVAEAIEVAIDPAPFEAAITGIDRSQSFEQRLIEATVLIQRRVVDIWKLLSQPGLDRRDPSEHRPLPYSQALAELLAAEPGRLRIEPVDAARLLRALTLSATHPILAAEPRSAADIVDLFLNGAAA